MQHKDIKTTVAGIIAAAAMFATTNADVVALIGPAGVKIAGLVASAATLLLGWFAKDHTNN